MRPGGSFSFCSVRSLWMPPICVAIAGRVLVRFFDLLVIFRRPIVVAAMLRSSANRHRRPNHQRHHDCTYFFHLRYRLLASFTLFIRERRRACAPSFQQPRCQNSSIFVRPDRKPRKLSPSAIIRRPRRGLMPLRASTSLVLHLIWQSFARYRANTAHFRITTLIEPTLLLLS